MTRLDSRLLIAAGVLATLTAAVVVAASLGHARVALPLAVAAAGCLGVAAILFALVVVWRTRLTGQYIRRILDESDPAAPSAHGSGVRETIVLDRAFNMMSRSLQDTREELGRLVKEQAALRRVATLVAQGDPPPAIFSSVAREVGQVLGADLTRVLRYEPDEATTVIGAWGGPDELLPVGTCWTIVGDNIPAAVLRKCAPARMDCFDTAVSPLCVYLRQRGVLSGVGTPIIVNGTCCWGVMTAFSRQDRLLPRDAEKRIRAFTDLVATAIGNVNARADLIASRARIVTAADEARRRIERDLHDGTQQRLVSLALEVRTLKDTMPDGDATAKALVSKIAEDLSEALDELRETARGIHPGTITKLGLVPAIKRLAGKSPVPVTLDARIERRLPQSVEIAGYYVVAEALTNAAKHAGANTVTVEAKLTGGHLLLLVSDDGRGGADPARGTGLTGLTDRIESLHGSIEIVSPPGEGTLLHVELPIPGGASHGHAQSAE
jgi:signal transduction histidine kinase